jgi:ABC-type multidrug transport system fused ATPase/permease subunit
MTTAGPRLSLWSRFKCQIEPALPFLRRNYRAVIIGGVGIILSAGLVIPGPLFTRYIIDSVIPRRDLRMLALMAAAVVGILAFTIIVDYVVAIVFARLKTELLIDLRVTLLRRLHGLHLAERQKYPTGYLLSRIDDDTTGMQGLFIDTFTQLFSNTANLIVTGVTMVVLEWRLACCVFALLPPFLYFSVYYSRKISSSTEAYYEKRAQMVSGLEEALSLCTLSVLFNKAEHNVARYRERALAAVEAALRAARYSARYNASTESVLGLMPITIVVVGCLLLFFYGQFSVGSLVAFISLSGNLFSPASELVSMNADLREALVALRRYHQMYSLAPQSDGTVETGPIETIRFREVSFAYPDDPPTTVLDRFDLEIRRGARLALVGGSGSGKSTVVKLLLRLFDPVQGALEINGVDARELRLASLRAKIGYVEQEPRLFDDSVLENILFGLSESERAGLSEESLRSRVENVVKLARLDFLDRLSDGLLTPVNQAGASLSVGQKQRIAIARALIRNPEVLILDEATANLDSISEAAILETVKELPPTVTVLIVSHRLSFIRSCDPVIVLEQGRIVERGAPAALLADPDGHFRRYAEKYQL